MSKGLEALKILKNDIGKESCCTISGKDILERYTYNDVYLNIIEKELKALEIISELPTDVKQEILNAIYTQTKDESIYDLLKEVLL